jgi:hypothetical protein
MATRGLIARLVERLGRARPADRGAVGWLVLGVLIGIILVVVLIVQLIIPGDGD